jgi:hypothetical protein
MQVYVRNNVDLGPYKMKPYQNAINAEWILLQQKQKMSLWVSFRILNHNK